MSADEFTAVAFLGLMGLVVALVAWGNTDRRDWVGALSRFTWGAFKLAVKGAFLLLCIGLAWSFSGAIGGTGAVVGAILFAVWIYVSEQEKTRRAIYDAAHRGPVDPYRDYSELP